MRPAAWAYPPEFPPLHANEVHVWQVHLDLPPVQLQPLCSLLSGDERARAALLQDPVRRERFVTGRALLRTLIACYAQRDPKDLTFSYGAYGKPFLDLDEGTNGLQFNVSHSGEVALYAFARGRRVGVDIEQIRQGLPLDQLAKRVLSTDEAMWFRTLPDRFKTRAFFHCWTRKEAYTKAVGAGCAFGLRRLTVTLLQTESPVSVPVVGEPQESTRWSMIDLTPRRGYAAALVVEHHQWRLRCLQWPQRSPVRSRSDLLEMG